MAVDPGIAMLARAPEPTGDPRLDALMGGIAEYLYKRWTRRDPPAWMSSPIRYLKEPWLVAAATDPGLLEYVTFASPPEFKSRNLLTDEAPLRRAGTQPR